jgi:hypothetical protein
MAAVFFSSGEAGSSGADGKRSSDSGLISGAESSLSATSTAVLASLFTVGSAFSGGGKSIPQPSKINMDRANARIRLRCSMISNSFSDKQTHLIIYETTVPGHNHLWKRGGNYTGGGTLTILHGLRHIVLSLQWHILNRSGYKYSGEAAAGR